MDRTVEPRYCSLRGTCSNHCAIVTDLQGEQPRSQTSPRRRELGGRTILFETVFVWTLCVF